MGHIFIAHQGQIGRYCNIIEKLSDCSNKLYRLSRTVQVYTRVRIGRRGCPTPIL